MKKSRRQLSINVVIDRFFFKNNQIMFFPCFIFMLKTDLGLPQTGLIFYYTFQDSPSRHFSLHYMRTDEYNNLV